MCQQLLRLASATSGKVEEEAGTKVTQHPAHIDPRRAPRAGRRRVRERRLAKFWQNVARFRLYRLRFLQENMRFAAFFKIYQILKLKFLKLDKILQNLRHLQFFC